MTTYHPPEVAAVRPFPWLWKRWEVRCKVCKQRLGSMGIPNPKERSWLMLELAQDLAEAYTFHRFVRSRTCGELPPRPKPTPPPPGRGVVVNYDCGCLVCQARAARS